jgi:hypothetical protein
MLPSEIRDVSGFVPAPPHAGPINPFFPSTHIADLASVFVDEAVRDFGLAVFRSDLYGSRAADQRMPRGASGHGLRVGCNYLHGRLVK